MTRTGFALKEHVRLTHTDARAVESHAARLVRWPHWPTNIEDITAEDINRWTKDPAGGFTLSASTIGTRLSVLKKAMARAGVAWPVDVKMPQRSKRPKWVLPIDQQANLINAILGKVPPFEDSGEAQTTMSRQMMVDYIVFVTETGLRVEEVLRIEEGHLLKVGNGLSGLEAAADAIFNEKWTLEVMGTKTVGSYDLIPLSKAALEVLQRRIILSEGRKLFDTTYEALRNAWADCLTFLNVTDETATLKSLRRTFATRLAAKGIPATLLQKLMRHASLVTTSQYTNSIGLHEAARDWLN